MQPSLIVTYFEDMIPTFGNEHIPDYFPNFHHQPFPNQSYMVPMIFQKQNSQLSIFFKCPNYFAGPFPDQDILFVDSQLLCTNLTNSQPMGIA